MNKQENITLINALRFVNGDQDLSEDNKLKNYIDLLIKTLFDSNLQNNIPTTKTSATDNLHLNAEPNPDSDPASFFNLSLEELLNVPVHINFQDTLSKHISYIENLIQSEGRTVDLRNPLIKTESRILETEHIPLREIKIAEQPQLIDYHPSASIILHASLSMIGFVQESNDFGTIKSVSGALSQFSDPGYDGLSEYNVDYSPPTGDFGASTYQVVGSLTIVTDYYGNPLTLNRLTGAFNYTLLYPVIHNTAGIDYQTERFRYTVTDLDGDIASNYICIKIEDDIPTVSNNNTTSDETGLFAANDRHIATGNLLTDGVPDRLSADVTRISEVNGEQDNNLDGIIDANTTYGTIRVYTTAVGLFIAGDYVYTLVDATGVPDALLTINDNVNYTITDADGDNDTATLTIAIDLNQAPTAIPDNYAADESTTLTILEPAGLIQNDTDPDMFDILTVSEVEGMAANVNNPVVFPEGDIVTVDTDGTLVYEPNGQFEALNVGDTFDRVFSYTLRDAEGLTSSATVTITVNGENDPPIADDVNANGLENAPSITISLTGTDVDGTVSHFNLSTLPTDGTLYTDAGLISAAVVSTDYAATGNALDMYFKPDALFNGLVSLSYSVKDNNNAYSAATATASITVTPLIPPIVFDLDGNGLDLIAPNNTAVMWAHNGSLYKTGWVGPNDGILAYDANLDGKIDSLSEINLSLYHPNARTDLDGLRLAFDSNKDNIFDSQDNDFNQFIIWQDLNQDGISQPNELTYLQDSEIKAIHLIRHDELTIIEDNILFGTAKYEKHDNTLHILGDVGLSTTKITSEILQYDDLLSNDHLHTQTPALQYNLFNPALNTDVPPEFGF